MGFDFKEIIDGCELELKDNIPVINTRKVSTEEPYMYDHFVDVTFFYGKDDEFQDSYNITAEYEELVNIFSTVERGTYTGMQKASVIYRKWKPRIREIGVYLNEMGGFWLMYGVFSLVYNYNPHYSVLLDENWKKLGLWK